MKKKHICARCNVEIEYMSYYLDVLYEEEPECSYELCTNCMAGIRLFINGTELL